MIKCGRRWNARPNLFTSLKKHNDWCCSSGEFVVIEEDQEKQQQMHFYEDHSIREYFRGLHNSKMIVLLQFVSSSNILHDKH